MDKYFKKTINSYNKTANEYFNHVIQFEILPEVDTFCNLSKPEGTVLDLGCGPGHHSKIFYEKGFNVTGVDFSANMIKIAKRFTPAVKFQVMNILELKFQPNSFDSIWASASLIHIKKSDFPLVMENLKKILTENGLIYFSLKEGIGEENTIDKRYGGVIKFHAFYNVEEVEECIENSGFKLLKLYKRDQRSTYDTNPWIHVFARNIKKSFKIEHKNLIEFKK